VLFGLFISNDTLSFLVGTAFTLVAFSYIERPTRGWLVALGAMLGVGLLTKGTFLAFAPVTLGIILAAGWRRRVAPGRLLAQAALCITIAAAVGCYKFVENYQRFGRPIVHNLDFPRDAKVGERGAIIGLKSFTDFDLPRLVANPLERQKTLHSVPMLMYATTWYSYLRESNFRLSRRTGGGWLARLLCLAGVVPTALALIGFGRVMGSLRDLRRLRVLPEASYVAFGQRITAIVLFLATVAIVLWAGVKYDVFTCFQGRLLFPVFFSALLLMTEGFDGVVAWRPGTRRWIDAALVASYVVYVGYFVVEVASVLTGRA
jgi:4-amino-4-deoxy-L-arabinose transferase-like glycosyltransferase